MPAAPGRCTVAGKVAAKMVHGQFRRGLGQALIGRQGWILVD